MDTRQMDTRTTDLWTYPDQAVLEDTDIAGFKVEALDGSIGSVDEATYDVGGSYLVVDTGPWIFGKKVVLPAGVISTIRLDDGIVYVNRTKAEIENAPEFDEATYRDETYRSDLGRYYGEGGRGHRAW
jgi:hypothetical protein